MMMVRCSKCSKEVLIDHYFRIKEMPPGVEHFDCETPERMPEHWGEPKELPLLKESKY